MSDQRHQAYPPSENYALIVAGGSGTRMSRAVPKQFLLLNGKPVMMYTLEAFQQSKARPRLILVLQDQYHDYWKQLCSDHRFSVPHQLVSGGDTRFHSVKNGLASVPDHALVAVHDAVRPLIEPHIIDLSYETAAENGTAVVAVKSRDSVRRVSGGSTEAMIRDEVYLVQTPQTFRAGLLKKAYEHPYQDCFTDDASVAELAGHVISIVDGTHQNFKITYPEDIIIAEMLIKQRAT